jgi:tetratricopeptide (TPR) repeat protein
LEKIAIARHCFPEYSDGGIPREARLRELYGYPRAVTAHARVVTVVGLAALATVAAIVGVTLLQTRGEHTSVPGAVTAPRAGYPPLDLDFGVRADAQARALARAQSLYNRGNAAQAAPVFRRFASLEAQIGAAFAAWKDGHGLDTLRRLAAANPRSALVALHLGWADYWAGRNADALSAWQDAVRLQPDTPYAVAAEDALHPQFQIPGLPPIVTTLTLPRALAHLPAAEQLGRLRAAARPADANAKLLYGLALWNLRRPVSAETQFAAAARLRPGDVEARVAAAVGRFTKASPARAFGRLGPLTAVFPRSPAVEFHLGLLLLWIAERKKAETHLRAAVADGPQTIYAKEAKVLLASLAKNGTR